MPTITITPNPLVQPETLVDILCEGLTKGTRVELTIDGALSTVNRTRIGRNGSVRFSENITTVGNKAVVIRDYYTKTKIYASTTLVVEPAIVVPPPTVITISNIVPTSQETTAVVTWHTNINTTGKLEYQKNGTTTWTTRQPVQTTPDYTDHEQNVSGLTPDTLYSFRITATDGGTNTAQSIGTFRTLKTAEPPPVDPPPPTTGKYPTPRAARYVATPNDASPTNIGDSKVDPITGSLITRLTTGFTRHGYARRHTDNLDGTLLFLPYSSMFGGGQHVYDTVQKKSLGKNFVSDFAWSNKDANLCFGPDNGAGQFVSVNVRTGARTNICAIPSGSWTIGKGEGRQDKNDKYVALTLSNRILVIDIPNKKIVIDKTLSYAPNNSTVDPSGKHVVSVASEGGGSPGVFVFDIADPSKIVQLDTWGQHGDVALDKNGDGIYVQTSNQLNAWHLPTRIKYTLLPVSASTFTGHVSGTAHDRPGYITWSDQGSSGTDELHDMICTISTDGHGAVEVVQEWAHARHRTGDQNTAYEQMPMASASRNGAIIYASMWDTRSLYKIEVK